MVHGPACSGLCRQVVLVYKWSLVQILLYAVFVVMKGSLNQYCLCVLNVSTCLLVDLLFTQTSDVQTACMVVGQASGFISKEQQATGWFKWWV